MAPFVAPDLPVVVRDCIRSGLTGLGVSVPLSTRVPNPRPKDERFVTYQVTGGRKQNLRIGHHLVIVHVHDKTANEVACRRLARQVAAVLEDAYSTVSMVGASEVESCQLMDDPDLYGAGVTRYQVIASWTVAYPTS